jgi:N-methylhydantoinase B
VQGGEAAPVGCVTVVKPSGDSKRIFKTKAHPVGPGDIVIMEVGGGGGYGPPEQRPRDLVRQDVLSGYVSVEAAVADYGLKIATDGSAK